MTNLYDVSLGLTAVLLLVALGWSVVLRRRVREQAEQIRSQLARETALEEKYRGLFEQANDMVFAHELGGKLTVLNKAGERILGCARERAYRMSLREFVVPTEVEAFEKWLDKCATGITPPPLELEVMSCTRVQSTLEVNARVVRDGEKVVAIEGIARDITAKKRAEEALRQSEERFSSAFRVSPVAIGICSLAEWRFVDVNESFLRLFGYHRDEVINHTIVELELWAKPEDRTLVEKLFREGKSICGVECQFRIKGGAKRTTLLFAERINLGNVPCALTIVHDITDRLNLEAQLRNALKMEAVGRLAAGVAHDFNNLLTIIQGNADLAREKDGADPEVANALDQITDAARRSTGLTRQLLTFSRQQNLQRKPVDLNAMINNGIKMFKHLLREDIVLRFKFSAHLPVVNADPTMMEQVLMNLVVNARDAMPKGGDLTISTCAMNLDAAYAQTHPEATAGHFVCLSVIDTGCGMDATTQARIFEPFFTTKEVGKGTGLGLATVYGVIKQHEGWIEVQSEPGHGSTFRIFIPAGGPAPSARTPLPPKGEGRRTILVVQEEAAVAGLVHRVLESEGYKVLEATDGLVAMQVWNDHRAQIDLMVADVRMPHGMSGVELADNLWALKPDLKVIYTSGDGPDTVDPEVLCGRNAMFLAKPYPNTTLVQSVRSSLNVPLPPVMSFA